MWVCVALGAALVGGCGETCILNGECAPEQICIEGDCRRPCRVDDECPVDLMCLGGACRTLRPGERPPCYDDAGCDFGIDMTGLDDAALDARVDASVDAVVDMRADVGSADLALDSTPTDGGLDVGLDVGLDGATPDGGDRGLDATPPTDASRRDGLLDGATDGGPDGRAGDGALPDAALPADPVDDLTGLYAVTTTVVVATGGDLGAGEIEQRIARLVRIAGTVYGLEFFTTDGEPDFAIERVDLATPDGPGRYQFEFVRQTAAPEPCTRVETRFQRGRYAPAPPLGFRLAASEERGIEFVGENCAIEGHLVRVEAVWQPLPPAEEPITPR